MFAHRFPLPFFFLRLFVPVLFATKLKQLSLTETLPDGFPCPRVDGHERTAQLFVLAALAGPFRVYRADSAPFVALIALSQYSAGSV